MEYAKGHWKTLVAIVAVALVGASLFVMDTPSSALLPSTSTPQPSPTPNVGSAQPGTVKADTFGITITLAPTQPPQGPAGCARLAVDLVLDTSSSMKNPRGNPRIEKLKDAVKSFVFEMPDEAVFAAQRFDRQARNVVSPVILKDGKSKILNDIDDLDAAGEGGTHTREGLYRAIRAIEEGNEMFPGRQWTVIVLSDGAPNPEREEGTEPAAKLKGMGVKVITIGLDMDEEENVSPEEARDHMRDVASSPSDFIDADSESLDIVYQRISENLCQ